MKNSTLKTIFNLLQMAGDVLLLNIAIVLAFFIRFGGHIPRFNFESYVTIIPVISILAVLLFNFYSLYSTVQKPWAEVLASVIVSVFILTGLTVIVSYMTAGYSFPRTVFFIAAVIQVLVISVWRWLMFKWEATLIPPKKIIVFAPKDEAACLINKIINTGQIVIGAVIDSTENTLPGGVTVLGIYGQIEQVCISYSPDAVYVAGEVPETYKERLAQAALQHGWQVYVVPGFYEIMVSQAKVDQLQDTPVLQIGVEINPAREHMKRLLDCVIASVGLLLTLPIILLAAAAIKLTSPGPVFYRQERVSKHGKKFMLYKLRTMIKDAEKHTGPVLAAGEKDPRITKVGRFLRATRLDELPQLINVLKGDMSIVGPRPERPFFVEQFEKDIPGYSHRHLMKAGITGLAQISGRYSTSAEDKLRYDLLYAKNATPFFDLRIMLQTVKVLLMRDKAS